MKNSRTRPNPWPLAIMAFFALFITGIVVFIVFATRNKMELVRPDYYEQEIRFQQQIDREDRTRRLSAEAAIVYDSVRGEITIVLPSSHAGQSVSGRIEFYRPSEASLDRGLQLAVNSAGIQRVDAKPFQAGLWKVRVFWTVDNEEFYFDRAIVVGSNQI